MVFRVVHCWINSQKVFYKTDSGHSEGGTTEESPVNAEGRVEWEIPPQQDGYYKRSELVGMTRKTCIQS